MIAAPMLSTNAQGAVIATSPASMPLHIIDGSGRRLSIFRKHIAPNAPVKLDNIVLTKIEEIRRSVPESVEPGLKPNQPNARMNVPMTTIGMLWPGNA